MLKLAPRLWESYCLCLLTKVNDQTEGVTYPSLYLLAAVRTEEHRYVTLCYNRSKMDSRLIFVMIGVFTSAFGRSEAIDCYSCSSATDSRCSDEFNSNGVGKCQGTTCAKASATTSGSWFTFCSKVSVSYNSFLFLSIRQEALRT